MSSMLEGELDRKSRSPQNVGVRIPKVVVIDAVRANMSPPPLFHLPLWDRSLLPVQGAYHHLTRKKSSGGKELIPRYDGGKVWADDFRLR